MTCPHLDVRRRLLVGGVRSSGESPSGGSFYPAAAGEGKAGPANCLNPCRCLVKQTSSMECRWRGYKDWPLRSGRRRPARSSGREEHRRPRGREGADPGRSSCVRNAVTPSRSGRMVSSGKPTVRRAQLLGGNRMAEKRTPVAERQRETHRSGSVLQLIAMDNRPDTGPGGPARKGADAIR
jgi:hypothetical protein